MSLYLIYNYVFLMRLAPVRSATFVPYSKDFISQNEGLCSKFGQFSKSFEIVGQLNLPDFFLRVLLHDKGLATFIVLHDFRNNFTTIEA